MAKFFNSKSVSDSKNKREKVKRAPTFAESLLALIILIGLIAVGFIGYGLPINPILMLASFIFVFMAFRCGWKWEQLQNAIVEKFKSVTVIILMNFLVGGTIAACIYCGTIPYLIYLIFKIINPNQIYLWSFISCCIFSLVTGTSWTTAGTIGLAMFGAGLGMGADPALLVAAIVSGAIFGDKLSPISETTILAPLCAGTTVYEHIYSMLYTTVPTAVICAVFFFICGRSMPGGAELPEVAVTVSRELSSMFKFSPIVLIPFILIFLGSILKWGNMPSLCIATFAAVFVAIFYQKADIADVLNAATNGMKVSYLGFEDASVLSSSTISIVQRGGMTSMAGTNITVCCGFVLAAIMSAAGFLQTAFSPVLNFCRGRRVRLITSTLATDFIIMSCAGSSYPAHIIVSEIYKREYFEQGLDPKVLSRTLEDVGTMTTPLVPWTASGAYYIGLFGVAAYGVGGYCKYALNCWLNPIAAIILAVTGIGMFKMSREKRKMMLDKLDEEARNEGEVEEVIDLEEGYAKNSGDIKLNKGVTE